MISGVRLSLHAFTLIELIIVLSIMVGLAAAATPGVMASARRSAVNAGATKLQAVVSEAQRMARSHTPLAQVLTAADHYGIAIVTDEGAPYATILYGTSATHELLADDGLPVHRAVMSSTLLPEWSPTSTRLAWFFQYGTGRPIQSPTLQSPVDVGTAGSPASGDVRTGGSWWDYKLFSPARPAIPASPICTSFQLRHRNGQLALAVAMYGNGLIAIGDAP